ncbi:hypothetical protein CXY01_09210 [Cellulomonas xylanilytica]|uniref:Uncharacterized protein n=1 Tax=Cellulomonas xylanilytica TaxID=233583 RepID=A0A510V3E3_9CELL|nr:hypothetical protein CXY01_09210 [Cellulomonas xylanilytica]
MLRGVLVVLSWAVCVFVVATVVQSTGTAGSASGRWVSALAVLVALVPTWFLVRRARVRWWLMLVAVIVLVAAGLGLGRLAGPSLARMSSVGSSLPMAAGAQLLTTSSSERTWCAGECSRVTYVYAVPDFDAANVEVAQALVAEGWAPGEPGRFCRDGLGVNVTPDDGPDVDRAPEVPSGTALLSMTTSVCDG